MAGNKPTKRWPTSSAQWPKTVKEAVDYLYDMLPDKVLATMASMNDSQIIVNYHRNLGMDMRNNFGLWDENESLRRSCKKLNPDDCSSVILKALRDKAKKEWK